MWTSWAAGNDQVAEVAGKVAQIRKAGRCDKKPVSGNPGQQAVTARTPERRCFWTELDTRAISRGRAMLIAEFCTDCRAAGYHQSAGRLQDGLCIRAAGDALVDYRQDDTCK